MVQIGENILVRFEIKDCKLVCYVYRPIIQRLGAFKKMRRLEVRRCDLEGFVGDLKQRLMNNVSEKYGRNVVDITNLK